MAKVWKVCMPECVNSVAVESARPLTWPPDPASLGPAPLHSCCFGVRLVLFPLDRIILVIFLYFLPQSVLTVLYIHGYVW